VTEETGLSCLMKPANPLPECGARDPASSTDQAGITGSLIELYPQKSPANVGVHCPTLVETMCANHTGKSTFLIMLGIVRVVMELRV
jgi:hypothetical protein